VRLTDYSVVLFDAVNLCGFDLNNITDQTFRTIRQFASQRLRIAWEQYPWSFLTKYVEAAVTTDTATDVKSVTIPTDAGEIVGVFSRNPLSTTQALNVSYALVHINSVERIIVNAPVTSVWIEYRTKAPILSGDAWSPTVTYSSGVQCYFDAGCGTGSFIGEAGKPIKGNFYTASVTLPVGTKPVNDLGGGDSRWGKVSIPHVFGAYIARGVFADFLRSEQQYEDAGKADVDAGVILEQEYDKELRQQGQIRRINFIDSY